MSWYTWVFSGLGTSLIVAALTVLHRKFFAKPSAALALSSPAMRAVPQQPERISTEPTPPQMFTEIKKALPFDREHATEKYINLDVIWKLRFVSVRSEAHTTFQNGQWIESQYWSFYCTHDSKGDPSFAGVSFSFTVVPTELKLLREGDILWVQGRVKWIRDFGVVSLESDPTILEVIREGNS